MNIAELKKEFSGCACGRAHTTALEDVVVDSGVEPGERVVTAGVYQLRQGERVRILK